MPLKTVIDHEGARYALLDGEGHPIYQVGSQDVGYDGETLAQKLSAANSESSQRRLEIDQLKTAAKAFEGLDIDAARKALATVANLDAKQLVDAGEVEKVKQAAIEAQSAAFDARVKNEFQPVIEERDTLKKRLEQEMIGNRFATSKFIADKIAVPAEMVQAMFGRHFQMADGEPKFVDAHGAEIFSRARAGEKADFEEALEIIVDGYPHKETILKGANQRGAGTRGGPGDTGLNGVGKTMTRTEAAELGRSNPAAMAKAMAEGVRVVDDAA